jgi:hypothetical protein
VSHYLVLAGGLAVTNERFSKHYLPGTFHFQRFGVVDPAGWTAGGGIACVTPFHANRLPNRSTS